MTPPRQTARLAVTVAGLIGSAWLGAIAAVAARQRKLLFDPVRNACGDCPASAAHLARRVVLPGSDGTQLCGWYLVPSAATAAGAAARSVPAAIYFGGRSEDVSWIAHEAASMFPGMALLAVNHRGYGESHGIPGERQMMADGRLLFDWLVMQAGIDADRIALVGRSLGSCVALQVAAHRPVAALVLMTPFDSVLAMVRKKLPSMPVGWMLRHRFESVRYASRVSAPVLVLRAESDDIVPPVHTDALVAQLSTVVCDAVVPGSDHCNIPYLSGARERIAAFLGQRLLVRGGEPAVPAFLANRRYSDNDETMPAQAAMAVSGAGRRSGDIRTAG